MSKPNLLAIVTTLFLASAVAGLTAGKSPKTFRCDLRWSADQSGGHALNLVIEEQVDGSFRASVANRFGHRFSKGVPVEDAERFFRRIEAIPKRRKNVSACSPLYQVHLGDRVVYSGELTSRGDLMARSLKGDPLVRTTIRDALCDASSQQALSTYYPSWIQNLYHYDGYVSEIRIETSLLTDRVGCRVKCKFRAGSD